MELDLHQIDLRDTMHEAASSVTDLLKARNVTLNLKQARQGSDSGQFVADATRVQQVLYNLLSNAVTFSPEGSSITLESAIEIDTITLRVSDMGPGIPADQQPTIFERF